MKTEITKKRKYIRRRFLSPLASLLSPGFTLIELLVSVALFSVVMLISVGSLLTVSEANRKAETVKSVVNNLNFALDSMSRIIRTGTVYHCDFTTGAVTVARDCVADGATSISFRSAQSAGGNSGDSPYLDKQMVFRLNNGRIEQSSDAGVSFLPLTAPEVIIDEMKFYVEGSAVGDDLQPRVVMTLAGHIDLKGGQRTKLELQTTVTQRLYDQ